MSIAGHTWVLMHYTPDGDRLVGNFKTDVAAMHASGCEWWEFLGGEDELWTTPSDGTDHYAVWKRDIHATDEP